MVRDPRRPGRFRSACAMLLFERQGVKLTGAPLIHRFPQNKGGGLPLEGAGFCPPGSFGFSHTCVLVSTVH